MTCKVRHRVLHNRKARSSLTGHLKNLEIEPNRSNNKNEINY